MCMYVVMAMNEYVVKKKKGKLAMINTEQDIV